MAIPLEGKLALRWVLQGAALALIPLLISFCESSYPVLAEWLNHSFYVVLVAFVAMNYAVLFVVNRHRKLHQQVSLNTQAVSSFNWFSVHVYVLMMGHMWPNAS